MIGKEDIHCPRCRSLSDTQRKLRLRKHLHNKAFDKALKKAKKAGKVITLYTEDCVTGIHYRTNKHGQYVMGGRGKYND